MEDKDNRELLKAKSNNLIVYVSGLQDPYFMGEDNSNAKWTLADIGKLYSNKCLSMPLEIRLSEHGGVSMTRITDKQKSEAQEYFRIEYFNTLRVIEYFKKPREQAVSQIKGPFKMLEFSEETAESVMKNLGAKHQYIGIEDLVQAVVCLTSKEQNPTLMETLGYSVKKGARAYITLKKQNNVPKKAPWKTYREYDLILLYLAEELEKKGLLKGSKPLTDYLNEELANDKFKRDDDE